MACVFVDVEEPGRPMAVPALSYRAEMLFKGRVHGKAILAIEPVLVDEIVSNILGLEPDDANVEKSRRDGAAEVMNVLGAHVVGEVAGRACVDMTVPIVESIDATEWQVLRRKSGTIDLSVEGKRMLFLLDVEDRD
jgi:hypothetical protein